MERTALVAGAGIAAALMVLVVGPFTFYADVVPILGPALPRPQQVPKEAAASYDWKASGMSWSWRRALPHGCVRWYATDDFATVELTPSDRRCGGAGRTLSYASFDDPIVFDAGGGGFGGQPCPYSVSHSEVMTFRKLVAEGLDAASTRAERIVLSHVDKRLAVVDGRALMTDHTGGCNDAKPADYKRPSQHTDLWEAAGNTSGR